RSAKRTRHLLTVLALQPSSAAISLLERPSAAASTARQRNANACELFGRRAHRSNTCRCSSSSTISIRCAIACLQSSSMSTTFRHQTAGPCQLATRDTRDSYLDESSGSRNRDGGWPTLGRAALVVFALRA